MVWFGGLNKGPSLTDETTALICCLAILLSDLISHRLLGGGQTKSGGTWRSRRGLFTNRYGQRRRRLRAGGMAIKHVAQRERGDCQRQNDFYRRSSMNSARP